MKLQKKIVCLMGFFMPLFLIAQQISTSLGEIVEQGIKWTSELSWGQIKQKAKDENKHIFIDCFATWCGPCKVMDQQVFSDEEVGKYFNDKFISVKVQMDKTSKDGIEVKSWYRDADLIGKEYHVDAYPCFIFISPNGVVVDKQIGGMQKFEFIKLAQGSVMPNKVYFDPLALYNKLKEQYLLGIRNYDTMPHIIKMAFKVKDNDFGKQLLEEHTNYVLKLSRIKRYTKDNIKLWSSFTLRSEGVRFNFFYKDGDKIDKVMKEKGYSTKVIDRTIWNEIVMPFLEQQAAGSGVAMSGMYLGGPGASRLKVDSSEADWKKLEKIIHQKFDLVTVKRNIVNAKLEWYKRHRNHELYTKYYLIKLERYTLDYSSQISNINDFIWETFINVTDPTLLNMVIPWGEKAVNLAPDLSMLLDSYANLLYKAGRINEAIVWQERAFKLMPSDKEIEEALSEMRKNQPTYLSQGAIWVKIK